MLLFKSLREEILQKLEKKKSMLRNSRAESEESKRKYVQKSQSRPMFEKLESDYREKILLPELNKSKEILKERKDFMKPIRLKDIK